jgi:hypothetical protein
MNVMCHTTLKGIFAWLKKVAHFLSKSCFLAKFNPRGNETCQKVQMLLFVDLLGPSMLFIWGWKFESLPLEMSKQILLPLKDSMFQLASPLFAHPSSIMWQLNFFQPSHNWSLNWIFFVTLGLVTKFFSCLRGYNN